MQSISMEKIAVMSVNYIHYSLDYFINSMCKCGVKNVDFWGGIPHYCRLDYSDSISAGNKTREIHKKMKESGLKIVMYTPETLNYPYSLSSPEKAVRNRTVDFFEVSMEDALNLGTDKVFINTGCGLLDLPREESWDRTVESVTKICEKAEKNSITMVVEQLQPYESNLLVSKDDLVRMIKEVGSSSLKGCVDVVAMAVMQEELSDYFDSLKDDIELIHLADGNPSGHYILGDGTLPLRQYINTIERAEYSKYITLEINDSIYWDDPHSSINKSIDYLKEYLI